MSEEELLRCEAMRMALSNADRHAPPSDVVAAAEEYLRFLKGEVTRPERLAA